MLSRKIPKLKLGSICKGDPNEKTNTNNTKLHNNVCKSYNLGISKSNKLGKHLLQGVPVLSIFALVGISMYMLNITSLNVLSIINPVGISSNNKAYAAESTSSSDSTSASLIIDNGNIKDEVLTTTGETTYVSHTVRVKADDIESYNLTISGPTNLTGTTTITGVDGKTGSAMTNNTWGYGWGDTTTSNASLTYNSFSTTGNSLASDTPTTNSVDFTKKLVFAAKFGDNATSGHYTASVNLNLVAEPKKVVGFGIDSMQAMTPEICAQVPIGTSDTLKDSRDNSEYTIRRNEDGKCWMTQNLRLVGSRTLTAANSNVTEDFSLPASATTEFNVNNSTVAVLYANNNQTNGAYYTWPAATAGKSVGVTSGEVTSSICPKGWSLPSQNDYLIFLKALNITDSADGSAKLRDEPYNFPYSGYRDSNLTGTGSSGYFQTRTASTHMYYGWSLYTMYLTSQKANATTTSLIRYGIPIRCVAYDKTTQYTYAVTFKEDDGVTLSDKSFSVTSVDDTYTFEPSLFYSSSSGDCTSKGWNDENGTTYTGGTITLTSNKPNITLTSTGNSGWCER